ncbi:hypothetical protein C2R22_04960 [Salinigranum rubrum]|uniref:Uncharacterized protein n=2 Tax=Salinigranum rubrum TaxID=755307 RepID=A0A2I8VGN8_9EURY|nr:hypothetical protein C2R22_04960 [Salinigranum rubrum]
MIFFNDPREVGNLLVSELYFNEVGPEDFRIELCVNSADPPTLQLAFERVETVMAQVHSKYHYFLRSQYKQYSDEFEVLESFNGTKTEYEVGSSIDTEELIPQPFCGETYGWSDDDVDLLDRISMSYRAREYIEYVMKAEAGGDQFFVLN